MSMNRRHVLKGALAAGIATSALANASVRDLAAHLGRRHDGSLAQSGHRSIDVPAGVSTSRCQPASSASNRKPKLLSASLLKTLWMAAG